MNRRGRRRRRKEAKEAKNPQVLCTNVVDASSTTRRLASSNTVPKRSTTSSPAPTCCCSSSSKDRSCTSSSTNTCTSGVSTFSRSPLEKVEDVIRGVVLYVERECTTTRSFRRCTPRSFRNLNMRTTRNRSKSTGTSTPRSRTTSSTHGSMRSLLRSSFFNFFVLFGGTFNCAFFGLKQIAQHLDLISESVSEDDKGADERSSDSRAGKLRGSGQTAYSESFLQEGMQDQVDAGSSSSGLSSAPPSSSASSSSNASSETEVGGTGGQYQNRHSSSSSFLAASRGQVKEREEILAQERETAATAPLASVSREQVGTGGSSFFTKGGKGHHHHYHGHHEPHAFHHEHKGGAQTTRAAHDQLAGIKVEKEADTTQVPLESDEVLHRPSTSSASTSRSQSQDSERSGSTLHQESSSPYSESPSTGTSTSLHQGSAALDESTSATSTTQSQASVDEEDASGEVDEEDRLISRVTKLNATASSSHPPHKRGHRTGLFGGETSMTEDLPGSPHQLESVSFLEQRQRSAPRAVEETGLAAGVKMETPEKFMEERRKVNERGGFVEPCILGPQYLAHAQNMENGVDRKNGDMVRIPELQDEVYILSVVPHISEQAFGYAFAACACLQMTIEEDMSQGVVWKQLGPLKWLPLMNSLPPCPSQIEDGTKRYAEFKQHCTPFRVEDIRSSLAKAAGGAGGGATPTHARSFLEKETSDAGLEVEDHDQQENVEEQSQDSTRSSFTIKASSSSSSASGGGHNSNTGSKLEDVLAEAFAFTNDQAALQRNSLNNLHDEDKEESPSSWLDLITSHASSAIDAVLETLLQVPPGNGMEAVVTPSSPTMHQRNLHRRPQQERDESVIMVANISTSAEVAATSFMDISTQREGMEAAVTPIPPNLPNGPAAFPAAACLIRITARGQMGDGIYGISWRSKFDISRKMQWITSSMKQPKPENAGEAAAARLLYDDWRECKAPWIENPQEGTNTGVPDDVHKCGPQSPPRYDTFKEGQEAKSQNSQADGEHFIDNQKNARTTYLVYRDKQSKGVLQPVITGAPRHSDFPYQIRDRKKNPWQNVAPNPGSLLQVMNIAWAPEHEKNKQWFIKFYVIPSAVFLLFLCCCYICCCCYCCCKKKKQPPQQQQLIVQKAAQPSMDVSMMGYKGWDKGWGKGDWGKGDWGWDSGYGKGGPPPPQQPQQPVPQQSVPQQPIIINNNNNNNNNNTVTAAPAAPAVVKEKKKKKPVKTVQTINIQLPPGMTQLPPGTDVGAAAAPAAARRTVSAPKGKAAKKATPKTRATSVKTTKKTVTTEKRVTKKVG